MTVNKILINKSIMLSNLDLSFGNPCSLLLQTPEDLGEEKSFQASRLNLKIRRRKEEENVIIVYGRNTVQKSLCNCLFFVLTCACSPSNHVHVYVSVVTGDLMHFILSSPSDLEVLNLSVSLSLLCMHIRVFFYIIL